jgi:hypothetical protein
VAFGHVIRQQHTVAAVAEAALANATVRPIALSAAKEIITLYEPMSAASKAAYGLFIGDQLAAAVVFGPDRIANLRHRYNGSTIALLRGACAPWAPRNAASKLLRGAMRLLPKQYTVVTAFSDSTLGERGVIYQAAGFLPVGASRGGRRVLVRYQGQWLSERSARARFGTGSAQQLAKLGFKVETVPRRQRWFAFRGTRRQQTELRARLGTIVPSLCC